MAIAKQIPFARDERPEEPVIIAMDGYRARILNAESSTFWTPSVIPNPGNLQLAILFAAVDSTVGDLALNLYVDWLALDGSVIAPIRLDGCTPADFAAYSSGDTSVVPVLIHTPPPRYRVRVEIPAAGLGDGFVDLHLAIGTGGSVGTARA